MSHASRLAAFDAINQERDAQDDQWGVQNHHPAYWLAIMGKQVGQLGSAILNGEWWEDKQAALAAIRHEAVQAAAVATALIEAIDAGDLPEGLIITAKPEDPRRLAKVLNQDDESLHGKQATNRICTKCDTECYHDADEDAWFHLGGEQPTEDGGHEPFFGPREGEVAP